MNHTCMHINEQKWLDMYVGDVIGSQTVDGSATALKWKLHATFMRNGNAWLAQQTVNISCYDIHLQSFVITLDMLSCPQM